MLLHARLDSCSLFFFSSISLLNLLVFMEKYITRKMNWLMFPLLDCGFWRHSSKIDKRALPSVHDKRDKRYIRILVVRCDVTSGNLLWRATSHRIGERGSSTKRWRLRGDSHLLAHCPSNSFDFASAIRCSPWNTSNGACRRLVFRKEPSSVGQLQNENKLYSHGAETTLT